MTRRLRSPSLFFIFQGAIRRCKRLRRGGRNVCLFFYGRTTLLLLRSLTLLNFYTNFQMDHYDDNNDGGSDDRDDRPPPSSGGAGAVV